MPNISRRHFLTSSGVLLLGTAGACSTPLFTQTPQPSNKPRVLRIAHMTDFHVHPEGYAPQGMALALRHAQGMEDPPDVIFNTGDSILDSLETSKARAEAQWKAFRQVMQTECHLPVYHVIGNHDVWGWGNPDTSIQSDPLYGKALAMQQLGLANRYYHFDLAGWRFLALDSTHPPNTVSQHPYIGKLDEEQFQWLKKTLKKTDPSISVCILSHIPILCACEFFDGDNEANGNWVVPAAWVHIDARRFRDLFLEYPNVRLCLSGHTHQHESLDYLGVRYLTNGAVCGAWWLGAYLNFPPAYVLVDLYADGSVDSLFVQYE